MAKEYNVDQILDERTRGKVTEYKIQWEGYGPEFATWESAQNIVEGLDSLVAEFIARKSGDGAQIRSTRRRSGNARRALSDEGPKEGAATPRKTPSKTAAEAPKSAKNAAASAGEAPKTPRGRPSKATAAATAAAAAAAAEPVAPPASAKKAPSTPRGAKAATKSAADAVKTVTAASSSSTVAVAAVANKFDFNTFLPVLLSALWVAGVVNIGLTVLCPSAPSPWFAVTAFVLYTVSSAMFKQYCTHDGASAQAAKHASDWSHLIHALATIATIAYFAHMKGVLAWQQVAATAELQKELLLIGFGFAVQDVLMFGAHMSLFRLFRMVSEATLYSAVVLCKSNSLAQLQFYLFFVLLALRVVDLFVAAAHVCAHKPSSRFMYSVGVVALLAALVYFVANVGPVPSVYDHNKMSVFGAFFVLIFLYVAPGETSFF